MRQNNGSGVRSAFCPAKVRREVSERLTSDGLADGSDSLPGWGAGIAEYSSPVTPFCSTRKQ
jgi:hypothetical protein